MGFAARRAAAGSYEIEDTLYGWGSRGRYNISLINTTGTADAPFWGDAAAGNNKGEFSILLSQDRNQLWGVSEYDFDSGGSFLPRLDPGGSDSFRGNPYGRHGAIPGYTPGTVKRVYGVPYDDQPYIDAGGGLVSTQNQWNGVFITTNNLVGIWGTNFFGQTGPGNTTTYSIIRAPNYYSFGGEIYEISCGGGFFAALCDIPGIGNKVLVMWGNNSFGQLGNGESGAGPARRPIVDLNGQPQYVYVLGPWREVACGLSHVVAIKEDGTMWAWGRNSNFQIGLGFSSDAVITPQQIGASVHTGLWHSCGAWKNASYAITSDRKYVYVWGQNTVVGPQPGIWSGLGYPFTTENVTLLTQQTELDSFIQEDDGSFPSPWDPGLGWKKALPGGKLLGPDGSLYTFGDNSYGLGGQGGQDPEPLIEKISLPIEGGVTRFTQGVNQAFAVTDQGQACSWGSYLPTGIYDENDSNTWYPFAIPPTSIAAIFPFASVPTLAFTSPQKWKFVTSDQGGFVYAAIKQDDTLWVWGRVSYQVDTVSPTNLTQNGLSINYSSPVQVITSIGPQTWSKVAVTDYAIAGIKTNGELWTWGANNYGQCGRNLRPGSASGGANRTLSQAARVDSYGIQGSEGTIRPTTDIQWLDVKGGAGCFIALGNRSGAPRLFSWGNGLNGLIGINRKSRSKPTMIGTGSTLRSYAQYTIDGTAGYVLTRTTDGQIWGWGTNNYYQLGNQNNTRTRSAPVRESTVAADWIDFATAGTGTIAAKTTLTLWSWGQGAILPSIFPSGANSKSAVVFTPNNSDFKYPWRQLTFGGTSQFSYSGFMILNSNDANKDYKALAWGLNSNGQLGLGNTLYVTTPQLISLKKWRYIYNTAATTFGIRGPI